MNLKPPYLHLIIPPRSVLKGKTKFKIRSTHSRIYEDCFIFRISFCFEMRYLENDEALERII
jgi:hypothetical protein